MSSYLHLSVRLSHFYPQFTRQKEARQLLPVDSASVGGSGHHVFHAIRLLEVRFQRCRSRRGANHQSSWSSRLKKT